MSIQAVNSPIINTITPRDYGAVRSEHKALRQTAAVIEMPFAALLEVSGKNFLAVCCIVTRAS